MSLPKACLFDLDGVIVDTVDAHFKAWKAMADELGVHFTEVENEQLKGVSRRDSMKSILKMGDIVKTEDELFDLTERKNAIYVDIISKMTPQDILPGVVEFLRVLKKSEIAVAIGSSSKNAPTILKAVGLDDMFEVVIDGNCITRSKPDPEVFLKGAEALHLDPSECLVLEDAISGVRAAKNAGMKVIGVGEVEHLNEADLVVPDLENLELDLLKDL
ncbi:MAG: beta-phosphoglucomutase [Flavobacteriales bacterium]|nr:beta-phosphoglucomutase [Flavobacteriales bacterium]